MNIQNVYNADVKAAAPAKLEEFENHYVKDGKILKNKFDFRDSSIAPIQKRYDEKIAKENAYTWKTPFVKIGDAIAYVWNGIRNMISNIFGLCGYGSKEAKTDDKNAKPKA